MRLQGAAQELLPTTTERLRMLYPASGFYASAVVIVAAGVARARAPGTCGHMRLAGNHSIANQQSLPASTPENKHCRRRHSVRLAFGARGTHGEGALFVERLVSG
mmetsp:Transcript_27200/g.69344  ORF Transcript_27200/g.69344 Transcript_27200/m.69344 type:complete len:105 (+) Transcript_27200:152-466(+)